MKGRNCCSLWTISSLKEATIAIFTDHHTTKKDHLGTSEPQTLL